MKFTKELIEKARSAASAEELLTLVRDNGVILTPEEAAHYFAELHPGSALSEAELGNVSGGCGEPEKEIYTAMICDACGCNTFWVGDYVNGKKYKCPMCSAAEFHGTNTTDYTGW